MVFLKNSQNLQESTCASVSFLVKLQAEACSFTKKEALTQVLSCKFCEIFKNTYITEHLQEIAPGNSIRKVTPVKAFSCKFYENNKNLFFNKASPVTASTIHVAEKLHV